MVLVIHIFASACGGVPGGPGGPPGDDDTADDDDSSDDDDSTGPSMECNGYAALCDLALDEVVFPATHNSMSNAEDGWIAPNQQYGIARQLEDGVRGMLLDSKEWAGGLYLCHGACELGSIPLGEALDMIYDFLTANPHEILVLIFQDSISSSQTATAFAESGLDSMVYTHPEESDWPRLGELIDANTRLVVNAEFEGPPPDWYHHAWDHFQDTHYAFPDVESIHCDPNRGHENNALFLLNHWVDGFQGIPLEGDAAEANSAEVLIEQVERCELERGLLPTLLAVDFYATGDMFEVVNSLNGVESD